MARYITASLLILSLACASQPASPGRPELLIRQQNELFFGSGTQAPISITIQLRNTAQEPITIRRIRIEPGVMSQYTVRPYEQLFNHALPAGDTRSVDMVLMAYTNTPRLRQLEPLSLRARVDYEYQGKTYREIWVNAVAGR